MAAFDDVQFPADIQWGVSGGPKFSSMVLETSDGFEFRNRNWAQSLRVWEVSHAVRTQDELDILLAFFTARQGMVRGFRFKDWSDYKHDMAIDGSAVPQVIDAGTDTVSQTFQLWKSYSDAGATHKRTITKPIANSSFVFGTNRLVSPTNTVTYNRDLTEYNLATATGTVVWLVNVSSSGSATMASNGTVTDVTDTAHGLTDGQTIYMRSWTGTNNGLFNTFRFVTHFIDVNTFSVEIDTSSGVPTGGDYHTRPHTEEFGQWEGEFDVPVRFTTDNMAASIDHFKVYSWDSIGIVETRDPARYVSQIEVTSSFHEVQFPPKIAFGVTGGPGFKSIVFAGAGGAESRNQNWDQARGKWDAAVNLQDFSEYIAIQEFFMARWGKAFGFRFKDWSDYKSDNSDSPPALGIDFGKEDVPENVQDTSNVTFHLTKTYTSTVNYVRRIRKPVLATIRFWVDGVELTRVTSGLDTGEFLFDDTTGIITMFSGDAPAPSDDLTWEGEFDVPARFDIDVMNWELENYGIFNWGSIPLIEIRQD